MVVAAIVYARLPEDEEGWCGKNRNPMQSEWRQMAAPGLYLSLGHSGKSGYCAFALPIAVPTWSNLATPPCPLLEA